MGVLDTLREAYFGRAIKNLEMQKQNRSANEWLQNFASAATPEEQALRVQQLPNVVQDSARQAHALQMADQIRARAEATKLESFRRDADVIFAPDARTGAFAPRDEQRRLLTQFATERDIPLQKALTTYFGQDELPAGAAPKPAEYQVIDGQYVPKAPGVGGAVPVPNYQAPEKYGYEDVQMRDQIYKYPTINGRIQEGVLPVGGGPKWDPNGRISVNVGAEEAEYDKTLGRKTAESFVQIQDIGKTAAGKLRRLADLENLLESARTGRTANITTGLAQWAEAATGLKLDPSLPAREALRAISNQFALEMRNTADGAGMPGHLSDKDREFLVQSIPSLLLTPEGNQQLITMMRRLEQRNQEAAKMARAYQQKRGRFDYGFYDELAQWAETNPLFSDLAPGGNQGAEGGGERERPPISGAQRSPKDGKWYIQINGKWNRVDTQ